MGLLVLCHALAAAVWVWFTAWNARRDAAAIAADGSADTLHQGFHRKRMLMRTTAAGALALVASLPAWPNAWPAVGLLAFFTGWFAWRFNTMISLLRGLDPYYLSLSPDAALFPDRLMTRWQLRLRPVLLASMWLGMALETAGLLWFYYA